MTLIFAVRRKQSVNFNLGESVIISNFASSLRDTDCTLLFDIYFFSSPKLVKALHVQRIYCIGKVRTNRN